jgi:hypothetical protein
MAFDGDRVTITYDAGIDRPLRLTPDEALALVQAPHVCHPNVLQDIARKLPAAQNEAAIALLLRVFAAEMPHANTPYREVLGLVHDICKRMDSQPRKHWLLHLHANYKAKRNFIKGLEGL